mgnify:CR=1 FL=1
MFDSKSLYCMMVSSPRASVVISMTTVETVISDPELTVASWTWYLRFLFPPQRTGATVGFRVGLAVGAVVGLAVEAIVGLAVGAPVEDPVGALVSGLARESPVHICSSLRLPNLGSPVRITDIY